MNQKNYEKIKNQSVQKILIWDKLENEDILIDKFKSNNWILKDGYLTLYSENLENIKNNDNYLYQIDLYDDSIMIDGWNRIHVKY